MTDQLETMKDDNGRKMMDCELTHLLRTHCDHEVIGEQGGLRDLLTSLRGVAAELHLNFEEALTESGTAFQHRLFQAFDPCV